MMNHVATSGPQPVKRLDNAKLGMWLYLLTELMLFSAIIGGFLNMKWLSPPDANQILNIPVTAVNTFILIISSTTVVLALSAIQDGEQSKLRRYLLATWILGTTFLSIQIFEYTSLIHEGFIPSTNQFSGGFYALTGFHGFHVFVGICWLTVLIVRVFKGLLPTERSILIETFGLYWHFVDIVWIVLFTIVYLV